MYFIDDPWGGGQVKSTRFKRLYDIIYLNDDEVSSDIFSCGRWNLSNQLKCIELNLPPLINTENYTANYPKI